MYFILELEKILNDSLGSTVDLNPYTLIYQCDLPKENKDKSQFQFKSLLNCLLNRSHKTAYSRGIPV